MSSITLHPQKGQCLLSFIVILNRSEILLSVRRFEVPFLRNLCITEPHPLNIVQTFKYRKKKKSQGTFWSFNLSYLLNNTVVVICWTDVGLFMQRKNNKNLVFVTFVVNCEFLLSTLLSECVKQSAYERHLSVFIS